MDGALASAFRERPVLVTGHTGFKGGWLTLWLRELGAHVTGFALPPEAGRPSLFETARVGEGIESLLGDLRDEELVARTLAEYRPEIVFHLAAQSLVRRAYAGPVETWATNVLGTVHLLEAVRRTPSVRTVVLVTSDKCYENDGRAEGYREGDPMGGWDPYSSSKGAAELATASYRRSFFHPDRLAEHSVGLATARAGNVLGGGDWADDRVVPDCVRALQAGEAVRVRNPAAVRPWQHVLEPLSGYLWLGARLHADPRAHAEAWNFGPDAAGHATVAELVARVVGEWGEGEWRDVSERHAGDPHEAAFLKLDCAKAAERLGWRSVWSLEETVRRTVAWYRGHATDSRFDGRAAAVEQIRAYTDDARRAGLAWAARPTPS